jgi:hypothetical protein
LPSGYVSFFKQTPLNNFKILTKKNNHEFQHGRFNSISFFLIPSKHRL